MSIIRTFHDKDHPFTMLSNEVLHTNSLSNAARGLWAHCMRRPDDWTFYITEIIANGKDKKTAIYSQLRELIAEGYVLRFQIKKQLPNKKIVFDRIEYVFFEFKITPERKTACLEELKLSFPHSGFLEAEVLDTENVPLLILNNTNTDNKNIIAKPEVPTPEESPTPAAQAICPAGGNNNSSSYECLANCNDLSSTQKKKLSKHSEPLVRESVRYCYHPTTQVEGGPLGRFKLLQYVIKNFDDYKETLANLDKPQDKKQSKQEILLGRFKRGQVYNGLEFLTDDSGASFLHPSGHVYGIKWTELGFNEKWLQLLKKLRIEI